MLFTLLFVCFLLGFLYQREILIQKAKHYSMEFDARVLFYYLAAFFGVMIMISRRILGGIGVGLGARLIAKLGAASYPVYLLHYTVGMIIINILADYLSAMAVMFCTIFIICALSFFVASFLEEPLRRWLKQKISA